MAEVDEREMAKEEKKELVLTSAKKHRGVVTIPPIALRMDNLGMRSIYDVLRDNGMDAMMQRDRIEIQNREVTIRTENETLVVEGNVSLAFQRVQQLLSQQYNIV